MNFVKKHPLLTAFLIPFFICIIICIGNGVYPFGDYCLLHMDLYHQYLPFFNELWEKLRNGASLMYTWNIGLGSDFDGIEEAPSEMKNAAGFPLLAEAMEREGMPYSQVEKVFFKNVKRFLKENL